MSTYSVARKAQTSGGAISDCPAPSLADAPTPAARVAAIGALHADTLLVRLACKCVVGTQQPSISRSCRINMRCFAGFQSRARASVAGTAAWGVLGRAQRIVAIGQSLFPTTNELLFFLTHRCCSRMPVHGAQVGISKSWRNGIGNRLARLLGVGSLKSTIVYLNLRNRCAIEYLNSMLVSTCEELQNGDLPRGVSRVATVSGVAFFLQHQHRCFPLPALATTTW
jgi:hypothetical protein